MPALATIKHRSPRWALDAANNATRAYGLATARWRVLPDFLIVGTKRGGTTSLWNWLDSHPQVLSMFPQVRGLKSTDYFFTSPGHDRLSWYRSHFHTEAYRRLRSRRRGRVVNGEASPYYMYGPHVPETLAENLPGTKLIVLLRDPVERAYSHYQERVQEGAEPLSFERALEAEESRTREEWDRAVADRCYYSPMLDHFSYRHRGVYLPQLQRLHAAFSADQVLVLCSEDLYRRPQAAFDQTCDFLGLSRHRLGRPERHNEIKRAPMAAAVRAELAAFYRPHNQALVDYLGRDFEWRE